MSLSSASTPNDRIAASTATSTIVFSVATVLGLVVFAVLPRLADSLLSLPWVPMAGPLHLVRSLDARSAWWLLPVAGLVLGAAVGTFLLTQLVVVTVSEREIVVTEGRKRTRLARSQVHWGGTEGRRLTLRDKHDVDLLDQKIDGEPPELIDALHRHGWPT